MAGNASGGKKAAATNIKRHGSDFYARIGRRGGQKGTTGGFYANPVKAMAAGKKGGTISSRRKLDQKQLAERRELAQKRYELYLRELEEETLDD